MEQNSTFRKIIHVDMDAFFAAVEQLDNPDLKGKPIAVGGGSIRGVVAAASYEARKFGVKSAMSGTIAKHKCPDLIFVKANFKRYKEISHQVQEIFYEYTDLVEPLSLDEAFLDVTQNKKGNPSATLIANEIRERISNETGLTASAGVSINKFIAKIASDINKPNGQKTIEPNEVEAFLENLPINKFFGIGKVTASKMFAQGIFTGKDLKQKTKEELQALFGNAASNYYDIVRGIHHSEVKPNRIRKSVGAETTFDENLASEIFMLEKLENIAVELEKRMEHSNSKGKTITLKMKYSDFTQQTRSKTIDTYIYKKEDFMPLVKELLFQEKPKNSVRLLGISFTNLDNQPKQPMFVQLKFKF